MLVLTRNTNQSIVIGHDIVITVLDVRGDQVRLGIKAPRHIDVHREEIFAALQKANQSAASPSAAALDALNAAAPKKNDDAKATPAPKATPADSAGTTSPHNAPNP